LSSCNRGFLELQIKKEILNGIIPKLVSDLKDYFTFTIEEEGTKVKIKNIQYSAISIALTFF